MMADVVRQGFICPFCMADMGDSPGLQNHVETSHPENGVELTDSVMDNVRGFLDKAKRGMRKLDAKMSSELSQVNIGVSTSVADLASMASAVQERVQEKTKQPSLIRLHPVKAEIGVTRSHSEYFLKHRDSSVNESAVRTNMLIIRLDKLINNCPTDLTKRKEFERSIVPWSADQESLHCGRCAAKFGITRRRHHCRLCGRVMCHQCSRFLGFLSARKLTNPALAAEMLENLPMSALSESCPSHSRRLLEITQRTTGKMKSFLEGAVGKIQSDGSEVSLGSLLQQDEAECLRVCGSCLVDLERREDMMEQRNPPILVASMASSYSRMASSLNCINTNNFLLAVSIYIIFTLKICSNGETMYTLKSAEEMRAKLFQKQREIDHLRYISFMFYILAKKSPQMLLFVGLKRHNYVKIFVPLLYNIYRYSSASVPSVSSFRKEQSPQDHISQRDRRQTDEGWTPQQTRLKHFSSIKIVFRSYNPFMEEEDMMHPMFEQRDIIKGYIREYGSFKKIISSRYLSQAAAAGRLEEVEMLERNLHDLEKEMEMIGLLS
uniref:FYVE-type domain-containing protein n=1 Tax=Heterorhabditis bacteriophora TaxID=37862 RepID=A0A1I7WNK0_HETBA